MSYIRFENIVKSFGSNTVLKDINLEVEKGQLVTLLGPSGCGKSTLLRCLSGLETVTSGKVYLDDRDITDVNPKDRDIGMVFQQYSLFPNMDVAQNVAFGLKMKKVPNAEIDKRVKEMVDIVHEYGKEAMMFMGDHWIGMEPYMDAESSPCKSYGDEPEGTPSG